MIPRTSSVPFHVLSRHHPSLILQYRKPVCQTSARNMDEVRLLVLPETASAGIFTGERVIFPLYDPVFRKQTLNLSQNPVFI